MSRIEYRTINTNLKSHTFNREEAMIIRSRFSSPDPKSSTKLENELGWLADEDFDSGILKTVEWYLKKYGEII